MSVRLSDNAIKALDRLEALRKKRLITGIEYNHLIASQTPEEILQRLDFYDSMRKMRRCRTCGMGRYKGGMRRYECLGGGDEPKWCKWIIRAKLEDD